MRFGAILLAALALASAACAQPTNTPEELKAEGFKAAQWAMASEAADALAKVSARFSRGDGPLARLAERRELQVAERDGLQQRMDKLYARTGMEGDKARAAVRARYVEVTAALKATDAEIDRAFPDYAELVSPKPLTIAQVQALLKPDEALLLVLVNDEASYIWGVTRERAIWARAEGYGTADIGVDVVILRRGLTGGEDAPPAYDRALAYKIYERLVRPVEGAFTGKTTLISVTGGGLATLPLGVLVTEPAGNAANGWLIDRYALAALPAVSSLRALRCARTEGRPNGCPPRAGPPPAAPGKRLALIGFGAPAGLAPPEADPANPRGLPAARAVFRGGLADGAKLRELASLPGSEAELSALRVQFPSSVVVMGSAATERAVKVTHREDLARSRYVVFSTHGLMAGELSGSVEPGLVLTPPAQASEEDDGYLAASEAAQLRLAADFVVLSACNTAASDGMPGGEGLSGLARAFFYAGARSVLVSHWAVHDEATRQLIKATFANIEGADVGARARALQHAQQTVRAAPGFADPGFWGAFTLVGEPER